MSLAMSTPNGTCQLSTLIRAGDSGTLRTCNTGDQYVMLRLSCSHRENNWDRFRPNTFQTDYQSHKLAIASLLRVIAPLPSNQVVRNDFSLNTVSPSQAMVTCRNISSGLQVDSRPCRWTRIIGLVAARRQASCGDLTCFGIVEMLPG